MMISTSKSEAMIQCQKMEDYPLWFDAASGGVQVSQVHIHKYGKNLEQYKWTDWSSGENSILVNCGEFTCQ